MHDIFRQTSDVDHRWSANKKDAPNGARSIMHTIFSRFGGWHRRMLSTQNVLRTFENFRVELALIPCSIWAAYCLWTPPSNFEAFPAGWYLARQLLPSEWMWGSLAALAAAIKLIGLSMSLSERFIVSSTILRCLGLGISGTFWFLLGISTVIGNPDSLYGPMAISMAISAWWVLIRLPTIPGRLE